MQNVIRNPMLQIVFLYVAWARTPKIRVLLYDDTIMCNFVDRNSVLSVKNWYVDLKFCTVVVKG